MDAKLIAQIFNDGVGSKYQTLLKGGRNEPVFVPNKNMNDVIYYKADYGSSALHEVAHWCIAGADRRNLIDYGYWYKEFRDADQQLAFERHEAKPQALEWIFSQGAGIPFRLSVDNFQRIKSGCPDFKIAVRSEAISLTSSINKRALSFLQDLMSVSGLKHALLPETYREIPSC